MGRGQRREAHVRVVRLVEELQVGGWRGGGQHVDGVGDVARIHADGDLRGVESRCHRRRLAIGKVVSWCGVEGLIGEADPVRDAVGGERAPGGTGPAGVLRRASIKDVVAEVGGTGTSAYGEGDTREEGYGKEG